MLLVGSEHDGRRSYGSSGIRLPTSQGLLRSIARRGLCPETHRTVVTAGRKTGRIGMDGDIVHSPLMTRDRTPGCPVFVTYQMRSPCFIADTKPTIVGRMRNRRELCFKLGVLADDFAAAIKLANESISSGKAQAALDKFIEISNS